VIEVLVEMGNGSACIRVVARGENIRRAVGIAGAFYPGTDVRVVYPIDPERFFVDDSTATVGLVGLEMPEKVAG
jgi:hypothetical protein